MEFPDPNTTDDAFLAEMSGKMRDAMAKPALREPVVPIPGEPSAVCWSCKKNIDAQDHFCRHCGCGQGDYVKWYYKHWGILVSIFLSGPLVLPFVWRSPVISKQWKWIYSVVLIAGTVILCKVLYAAIMAGLSALTGGGMDAVNASSGM